jgi:hypothetical protein
MLGELLPIARKGFSRLIRQFNMDVKTAPPSSDRDAPGTIVIESSVCRITIGFESGDPIVDISDAVRGRTYFLPSLITVQDPHFFESNALPFVGSEDESEVITGLKCLEECLFTFCKPMLEGIFDSGLIEKYHAFGDFLSANLHVIESLDKSDPIKMKYRKGDWTWVDDLRIRLVRKN